MLGSFRRSSPHLSCAACARIASATLVACLPPSHAPAQAENQTPAKANGRIYANTLYCLKPEGAKEDKKVHGGIIAIDPATGKWQMVVENADAVRLSPDRRTLIFWRYRDGIWKCDLDGWSPSKIFDYRGNWGLRPVWSADGKHVVVTKAEVIRKGSQQVPRWETWQIYADGGYPVKLPIPDTDSVHDWSGDGQWFVTFTSRQPHAGQLYLMKTDGTQERRLDAGHANWDARFSPDGKQILYIRNDTKGRAVCTVDVDVENVTELLTEAGPSVPDGAFWSPDGKQIAVILFDWRLENGGRKAGRSTDPGAHRIEIMDADGTNRRQVPLRGAEFLHIRWGDWR